MPSVSFVGVAVLQARAVQACTKAVAEAAGFLKFMLTSHSEMSRTFSSHWRAFAR